MDFSTVPLKLARLAVCFTILLQGVFGQRELICMCSVYFAKLAENQCSLQAACVYYSALRTHPASTFRSGVRAQRLSYCVHVRVAT